MREVRFSRIVFVCFLWVEACGGGGGGASAPAISVIQISPAPLVVQKGKSIQITATAKDRSGNLISQPDLTWSVSGGIGTITSGGLYTAPATIPVQDPVTVRVASTSNPAVYATASLFILTGSTINFPSSSVDITAALPQPVGTPPSFRMSVYNQGIYLTWTTTSQSGGTQLWYAKMDTNGQFLTLPHPILNDIQIYFPPNYSGVILENPNIALDDKPDVYGDPGVYIVWDDIRPGVSGNFQIYGVKGPNGKSCPSLPCFEIFSSAPYGQIDSLPGTDQRFPSIGINPLGSIDIGWSQNYLLSSGTSSLITYKKLNLNGTAANTSYPIAATSNLQTIQTDPQLKIDGSGNISFAWVDYGGANPPNINYLRLGAGQTAVESNPLVPFDIFSMTLDSSGEPFLTWSNSVSTTKGIFYSTTSNFVNFSNPATSLSSTGLNPAIKVDLLKNLYLKWEGSGNIIFEKISSGSTALSNSIATGLNSTMDIDSAGRVYLLFSTSTGPTISTFFLRGE